MPSQKADDPPRSAGHDLSRTERVTAAFARRPSARGFFQRLNVRLVLSLAFVSLIALTVSGLAITQILPGYFRDQARDRLETAAVSLALLVEGETDAARDSPFGSPRAEEVFNRRIFQRVADFAAGPVIPATISFYGESGQLRARAEPRNRRGLEAQGLRPDPSVPGYTTPLITLDVGDDRPPIRYSIGLSDAYTTRETTVEEIRGTLIAAGALALLGSLLVGVVVAARFVEPISALRRVAARVSQGHLDERATESGVQEVDELADQFNVMADRLSGTLRMLEADRDRLREFVADVSHELRTPIAALRMYTELQSDGQVDEPTRTEFLERSTEQIGRLEWLSTNLLDLSRIDAGIFPLDIHAGDLRDPIRSVVEAHAEVAERRGIALGSEVPATPVELRFDHERILQLLTNLVGNALKFTPRGGSVSVRLTDTPAAATLEVRDTGPGIPAAELPRIFERFYRGTNTGQARASGSGLGLAIVRSIVEMHGGSVDVASEVEEGTSFRIQLPRVPAEHDASVRAAADAEDS